MIRCRCPYTPSYLLSRFLVFKFQSCVAFCRKYLLAQFLIIIVGFRVNLSLCVHVWNLVCSFTHSTSESIYEQNETQRTSCTVHNQLFKDKFVILRSLKSMNIVLLSFVTKASH